MGSVLVFLILVSVLSAQPNPTCQFPGAVARCDSPKRNASFEWREATAGQRHQLMLRYPSGLTSMVLEFDRSVDVLWAPDGQTAAITDHRVSNESAVLILQLDAPAGLVDVEPAFERAFGRVDAIYRHGHRYFTAQSWASPSAIVFSIRAHDNGPPYSGIFVYELGATVRKIR